MRVGVRARVCARVRVPVARVRERAHLQSAFESHVKLKRQLNTQTNKQTHAQRETFESHGAINRPRTQPRSALRGTLACSRSFRLPQYSGVRVM